MTTLVWLFALAAADPVETVAAPPDGDPPPSSPVDEAPLDAVPGDAGPMDAAPGDAAPGGAAAPLFDPTSLGASELPEVALRYRIEVRFLPAERKLVGQERIEWTNRTGAPVSTLPVHLYLNGFAHDATTWTRGAGEIGRFDPASLLERYDDPWGFITLQRAQQATEGGQRDVVVGYLRPDDPSPLDHSLASLELPVPVEPGATATLLVDFEARVPIPIARTGAVPDWIHAAQWFPKIGVWDPPGHRPGWEGGFAARQFHGPTEFYADFADFDVAIDLPAGWNIVATGTQLAAERQGLPGLVRHRFTQRAVHDFAWVASPVLHVDTRTIENPGGGGPLAISVVVPLGREEDVERTHVAARTTFETMARRVGPYPYSSMKVVLPPWSASGTAGMEYPTLVTGIPSDPLLNWGPLSSFRALEATAVHEVIHNYFYGLVANDEQREAFLDEGFTSFWEQETMDVLEAAHGGAGWERLFGLPVDGSEMSRHSVGSSTKLLEPPRNQPSYLFYPGSAGHQIYTRTALLFRTVAARYGDDVVDGIFRPWFAARRFTHPTAHAFLAHVDAHAPLEVAGLIRETYGHAQQPDYAVKEVSVEPFPGPAGWVLVEGKRVHIEDPEHTEVAWPRPLLTQDPEGGGVRAEVTAAGYIEGDPLYGLSVQGELRAVELAPAPPALRRAEAPKDGEDDDEPAPEEAGEKMLYESTVRLTGPAWRHLPVVVRFVFSDGRQVTDTWDGRSHWRGYRFLREAQLDEVVIDPAQELRIDGAYANNAWRRERDDERGHAVVSFLTRLAEWWVSTLALWL